MKKSVIIGMLLLTASFSTFIAGFYLGRNYNHSPIQVSATEHTVTTAPISTEIASGTSASPTTTVPGLININTATLAQLDTLPGIGTVRAQAIIDYRNEFGPFESIEDLLYVDGIGEKTLEKLMDYITIGG